MSNKRIAGGAGGHSPLGLLIVVLVLLCLVFASAQWLPARPRLWCSFLLVVLLPGSGLAFSSLLKGLDFWEKLVASFVGSLLILVAAGLLSHLVGWGLRGVIWLVPFAAIIAAVTFWCCRVRRDEWKQGGATSSIRNLCAGALVVVSLVLASGLSGEMGPGTDAFDHIATVREIQNTGELLPLTMSYKYPEAPLPDPRKGFFHAGLAAMCSYSGLDPVVVWSWLPEALLPLTLLVVFCLGRTLTASSAGGLLSAVFWFLCFGGARSNLPAQVGYAHNVSEIASWVLILMLVKYAAGGRTRLIVFSAVGLAACCFIHISSIVLALAAWGCLLAAALVLGGAQRGPLAKRLGRAGVVWLLFGVPAASVKIMMSYAPANPIQLQSQNLMYLTDSLYIVNPMWVFSWLGLPGVLAIVIAVFVAFQRGRGPERLYLVGATLVPIAIVLNPILVPVFYSVVSYLVERFTWVIPYPYVLAAVVMLSWKRLREPGRARTKLGAAVLAVIILTVVGTGGVSRLSRADPGRVSYESWLPALEYLRDNVEEPAVVASDMLTSYSIPAFTTHHIVSTLHQHGSPNDPRGIDRVMALLDIMNPDSGPATLKRRLRRQEVDYILVNSTFDRDYRLYFSELDPASIRRLDQLLGRHPGVFRRVFSAEGLSLYAVDRAALEGWNPPGRDLPPYVLPPGGAPVGVQVREVFDGEIELLSVAIGSNSVKRGDALWVTCYWRSKVDRVANDLPWTVQVRIQRDYPKGRFYSPRYSKIYRKLLERIRGERYRWRQSHLPAGGAYPPSMWERSIIVDKAAVRIPYWMKPGVYEVTVSIGRESVYPNFTLRDFLRDDDRYAGVSVGQIKVN